MTTRARLGLFALPELPTNTSLIQPPPAKMRKKLIELVFNNIERDIKILYET